MAIYRVNPHCYPTIFEEISSCSIENVDLWISSNIKVGKIDHFWDIRFLPDFDPKMPFLAPISRNLGLNIESDVKNGFLDPKNIFLDILHEHFCDLSMKI